jgi:CspA family cold shock protein
MGTRQCGVVKFFSTRGYAFLEVPGQRDVFLHMEDVIAARIRWIEAGDKIMFDLENSDRGPRARNIKLESGAL